jgi:hypothetical protein
MTKAIRYGTKRREAFTRFLDDGRLEIDNNIAELAIRPIAIGRKNWLFAGSEAGGVRAAAIYSVVETAKMNGLEPQAYIADVITTIAADFTKLEWTRLGSSRSWMSGKRLRISSQITRSWSSASRLPTQRWIP